MQAQADEHTKLIRELEGLVRGATPEQLDELRPTVLPVLDQMLEDCDKILENCHKILANLPESTRARIAS